MPVYEYYCDACHTIYSFRVLDFHSQKQPRCPDCGKRKLEKQISMFSISKGRGDDGDGEEGFPDIDEEAMEKAMTALESEAGSLDDDNPRAMAKLMRRLYESTGLKLGSGMEEAIRRLESGEDPDKIEEEMGDTLEDDELLFAGQNGRRLDIQGMKRKLVPPRIDATLYDL